MEYKNHVRPGFEATGDRREAFVRLLDDDQFTTGLLYRNDKPGWRPDRAEPESLDDIAAHFSVEAR